MAKKSDLQKVVCVVHCSFLCSFYNRTKCSRYKESELLLGVLFFLM